jgi:hypothetical protein
MESTLKRIDNSKTDSFFLDIDQQLVYQRKAATTSSTQKSDAKQWRRRRFFKTLSI